MKKLFVAFCTMAMVSMVACKKDPVTPTAAPNPGPEPQQYDTREGAYDPVGKIVAVSYSDGTAPETWLWDPATGHLTSINDDDYCGGYFERISFTYLDDGRVDYVNVRNLSLGDFLPNMQVDGTLQVNYDGDYISDLSVVNNGVDMLSVQVNRNADMKIGDCTLDLSDNMLLDFFNMMLAQFLADSTGSNDNLATGVDNATGDISFDWNGDNVRQAMLHISFRVSTTVGTLVNVIGEDNLGIFGSYGQYLTMLPDNQPLYFNIAVGDTADYTYDNKVNPFYHFLGRLHISALTANNLVSESHNGAANIAISTSIMGSEVQLYQTSYPLPLNTGYYEYQEYNAAGCPLRVVDSDGVETTYQYME